MANKIDEHKKANKNERKKQDTNIVGRIYEKITKSFHKFFFEDISKEFTITGQLYEKITEGFYKLIFEDISKEFTRTGQPNDLYYDEWVKSIIKTLEILYDILDLDLQYPNLDLHNIVLKGGKNGIKSSLRTATSLEEMLPKAKIIYDALLKHKINKNKDKEKVLNDMRESFDVERLGIEKIYTYKEKDKEEEEDFESTYLQHAWQDGELEVYSKIFRKRIPIREIIQNDIGTFIDNKNNKQKILFTYSLPYLCSGGDLEQFNNMNEYNKISQKNKDYVLLNPINIMNHNFVSEIINHSPDILHISGHGSKDGKFYLEQEDSDNAIELTLEYFYKNMKDIKDKCKTLKVVILSFCYSYHQAKKIQELFDIVIFTKTSLIYKLTRYYTKYFYKNLFEDEKKDPRKAHENTLTASIIGYPNLKDYFGIHSKEQK